MASRFLRLLTDLSPTRICLQKVRDLSITTQHCQRRYQSTRPHTSQSENMMDIGNRRIFSEEHDMFRRSVRRFFQEEVVPNQDRWEKQRHVDRELWEKAGAAGLLGLTVPTELGGVGGDVLMSNIVLEEQGYVNGAGTAFSLHNDVILPYLCHYGTQEQKEKFIPDFIAGKKISAIAMTEPSAGSDLQGIKTNARKDGDDYILNGSKVFITNGYLCDVVIVVAITDLNAKKKSHGISLFLVEDGMPGFTKGKPHEKVGQKAIAGSDGFTAFMKRIPEVSVRTPEATSRARISSFNNHNDTCELFFEDVRLPKSALLGGENKGFYRLMEQLPLERLLVGVFAIAHAEFMFEETRNYVRQRKAFGKTLADIQVIQHKLADLKTQICVSRSFIDDCLEMCMKNELDTYTASMAKLWGSDTAVKVATECLQLHGGWGYMWEYPIARAFCDTRIYPIFGGSNEIMKELIYRPIIAVE